MIQLAYSSNSARVNGLTIHKVQKGVLSQTFINDVIKNAAPNELFIIDDSPRYYVVASGVSEKVLIDNILSNITYKEANAVNKMTINGKGGLEFSAIAPNQLFNNTGSESQYYISSNQQNPEYDVQRSDIWDN